MNTTSLVQRPLGFHSFSQPELPSIEKESPLLSVSEPPIAALEPPSVQLNDLPSNSWSKFSQSFPRLAEPPAIHPIENGNVVHRTPSIQIPGREDSSSPRDEEILSKSYHLNKIEKTSDEDECIFSMDEDEN